MLSDPGLLLAVAVSAGIGAALCLLVTGLRGTVVDPARPPGPLRRLLALLRSPALTGRLTAAVLLGVATLVLTRWPVAAAGLAVLLALWPRMFGGARAEQARIDRLDALVGWTESLRDTVAAHASLEQAIPATTDNASPLIRPALVRLNGQVQARAPLDAALLGLAAELDDPSADLVVAALILNVRRRGDRLGEVLTGLAVTAREEVDLRRRISAGRAGLRRGAQIVVVMTLAFVVFLHVFGGTYIEPYGSLSGQIALAVVISLFAGGFAWMRKLAAADPGQAFLARPGAVMPAADVQVVAQLTGAGDHLTGVGR